MMREFMRHPVFLVPAILLLGLSGCIFDGNRQASSNLGDAPPASPTMIEFATDLGMSWNPGMHRGMWRTETDTTRTTGMVHLVGEIQCPDRYRIIVTGAETSEKIFIGKTMYERSGNSAWTTRAIPNPHMILNNCGKSDPPPNDPARIRLLAEQFNGIQISGPVIREINGHPCREWTRTITEFNRAPVPLTMCYDTRTHALVQSKYGDQVTTFDFDSKVDIKPPL